MGSWQDDWWPTGFASPLDLLKKNTTGYAFTKLIGQPQRRMWWVKFITKNFKAQTKHTLDQQMTQEPLVITDCLQTQREHTLKGQTFVEKDGCCLSLRGWRGKKEKGERNLRLCFSWKHCLGFGKSMLVAQTPFLSILVPKESQLKLTEDLTCSTFCLPKNTALSAVVWWYTTAFSLH